MSIHFNSGYQIVLHANDACVGPTHGFMRLETKETDVLMKLVYPFVAQAPKELRFACVPVVLPVSPLYPTGLNCTQEIKSIWAKKKEVMQNILNQMPEGNAKNNYLDVKRASREFAATKKAGASSESIKFKVLGEIEQDEMLQVATAVILATKGIPQPVDIRFELMPFSAQNPHGHS